MTDLMTETKTYFGESLDEVLPQIRTELGPDAMIVRQREGVLGGIGGFFGRKCIEVDARPAVIQRVPTLPNRAVIDAYDTAEPYEPEERFEQPEPFEPMFPDYETGPEREPEPDYEQPGQARQLNGLEAMLAQSIPFATTLSSALAAEPVASAAPAPPPAAPAAAAAGCCTPGASAASA